MKKPAPEPSGSAPKPAIAAPRTLLVLVRHGDAGEPLALPGRDAARALTSKGRRQAKRAGKALARLGLAPHDVWTSRLVRARETARTALAAATGAHVAGIRVSATPALAPDAAPERIARTLLDTPPPPPESAEGAGPTAKDAGGRRGRAAHDGRGIRRASRAPSAPACAVRWLVGHDPHLARFAAFALGAPASAVRLRKGAFAVLAFDGRGPGPGTGVLTLLLDPDALRAVRRRRR